MRAVLLPASVIATILLALAVTLLPGSASQGLPIVVHTDLTLLVNDLPVSVDIASAGPLDEEALAGLAPVEPYTLSGLHRFDIPVVVRYNPAGGPGLEAQVVDGHAGWNSITPNFAYSYGGTTATPAASSICLSGAADGSNVVAWSAQGGNILGIACWNTGADECDILIDPGWEWGSGLDLQTVILHESGHCAGLGHSLVASAVMAPTYAGPRREPRPDDVAGICARYGCPPATPTPTATATMTPTPTPTPTPAIRPRAILPGVSKD